MACLPASPQRGASGGSAQFQCSIGSFTTSLASTPAPMTPGMLLTKSHVAIRTLGPGPSITGSSKRPKPPT